MDFPLHSGKLQIIEQIEYNKFASTDSLKTTTAQVSLEEAHVIFLHLLCEGFSFH